MKIRFTRKLAFTIFLSTIMITAGVAQEIKAPVAWSKPEAEKILNHSAWGQTQTDTDTSEMVYSPTTSGTASSARTDSSRSRNDQQSINNNRADRGATNQPVSVNYHVRLLSAKPIRQAFKRVIELTQVKSDHRLVEDLDSFVNRDFSDYIVVAVTFDSTDGRYSGPALQAFSSATIGTVKNKAYLERKDGKRLFVNEYYAPISDGLGAKFVFPRTVEGQKFLDASSGTVRFYCELTSQIKLNVTFKLSDMIYNGNLEY